MQASALTDTIARYQSAVTALEEVVESFRSQWDGSMARRSYDAYFELRGSAPISVDADVWMAENHRSVSIGKAEFEIASGIHSRSVSKSRESINEHLQSVLAAAGTYFGRKVASELERDPSACLSVTIHDAYRLADRFRRQKLDGRRMRFDPEGLFAFSFYQEIARVVDFASSARGRMRRTAQMRSAALQPAYAFVVSDDRDLARLQAASGATIVPMELSGRAGVAVRFDLDEDENEALLLVRRNPDLFEMTGPFHADPEFRFRNSKDYLGSLLSYERDRLDVSSVMARALALQFYVLYSVGARKQLYSETQKSDLERCEEIIPSAKFEDLNR